MNILLNIIKTRTYNSTPLLMFVTYALLTKFYSFRKNGEKIDKTDTLDYRYDVYIKFKDLNETDG
jgi:hypothetical protein